MTVVSDQQMANYATQMLQEAVLARLEKARAKIAKDKNAGIEVEAPPVPPPLDYEIEAMSRDGGVSLKFNGKMLIPPFVTAAGGRRLEDGASDLSSIDASKLFEASLAVKSEEGLPDLQYFFAVKHWDDRKVDLQFNFSSPLAISQGATPDMLHLKVSDAGAKYFVSAETLEPINITSEAKNSAPINRQLPVGQSAKELDEQVGQSSASVTAIIII